MEGSDQMKQILQLAADAIFDDGHVTPGPWIKCNANNGDCICRLVHSEPLDAPIMALGDPGDEGRPSVVDWSFVATVRSREPILARAVIAQAAEISMLREVLIALEYYCNCELLAKDRSRVRGIIGGCLDGVG